MKDYCIGCYWCYNGECIKGRGEYCPASSIKAARRKAKKDKAMGNFEFNLGSWLDDNLTDDQNGMLFKIYISKEGYYRIETTENPNA